jgi:hypothetical protein
VYDLNRPFGESCYRLISRTGQFVYLKTRGFLEVDEETHQVHSFVCVNTLIPDDEGRRLVKEMKKKFSVIITQEELDAMESDIPAVENPQQLEKAILNLITNLNNSRHMEDDDAMSMISDAADNEDSRSTKSPPLSIIPPKTSTIKPSIIKSVSVIASAIKNDAIKKEPASPTSLNSSRPSVLQKITNQSHSLLSPTQYDSQKQRSNSESSYKNYASPSSFADQVNIKVEPNILSPTSSLSSVDSESMPYLMNPSTSDNLFNAPNSNNQPNSSNSSEADDFSTPCDNIPIFDPQVLDDTRYIDTSMMATPAKQSRTEFSSETFIVYNHKNDSITATSKIVLNKNNNTSNIINRNTVLKRNHAEDTNGHEVQLKKRALLDARESNSQSIPSPLLINSGESSRGEFYGEYTFLF